jgi:citrate synthase
MLVLHAEHGGGNNSTFACRVLTSTWTDTYGALAGAVSSLKGPLHGGANGKVMEMFEDVRQNVRDELDEDEIFEYMRRVLAKESGDRSGKIYGLGHAVYTESDPRAVIVKRYAREMAEHKGCAGDFDLMERIERQGLRALEQSERRVKQQCANVDMYSGLVYKMLGIPEELYTPLFATARMAGWCAHRLEELVTAGRIYRPAYRSVPQRVAYVPIQDR